ncbi:MAG: hypothetical protein Q4C55_08725 [Eubacterium sp.]|nr:hypothetical protein [Eubacterium sp.]
MHTEKTKPGKIALALYIIAALFAVIALFSLYNVTTYITSLAEQGMDLQSQMVDVIMYYISNCAAWIFDAAALFGLGYLIHKLTNKKAEDDQMMEIDTEAETEAGAEEAQEAASEGETTEEAQEKAPEEAEEQTTEEGEAAEAATEIEVIGEATEDKAEENAEASKKDKTV